VASERRTVLVHGLRVSPADSLLMRAEQVIRGAVWLQIRCKCSQTRCRRP